MTSTISIDELLDSNNEKVCLPDYLMELVKSNLEVVPITTYKLRSNCSTYEYTKDQLDSSKDHINQLVYDILLANLDKVKYLDNRIYTFFKEGISCWLLKSNNLFEVNIIEICQDLELACDREYDYILTEHVYYQVKGESVRCMFTNNKNFLKFGGQYAYEFFEVKPTNLN